MVARVCDGMKWLPPSPVLEITFDASGTWGAHGPSWFQIQWDDRCENLSSAENDPPCMRDRKAQMAGLLGGL